MSRIVSFLKREITLVAAFAAAAVSCCFVPPDAAYLGYIDVRTLALLYALMVVVSGLTKADVFRTLARVLCRRARTVRALGMALVAMCFFCAMLITNDVAILTFVPFAAVVLGLAGQQQRLAWVAVLQTAAANLGSMLTPVGNPQNLYLYSYYGMGAGAFFAATVPVWLVSGAALFALCLTLPRTALHVELDGVPTLQNRALYVYLGLFAVCLLVVFRVLPWPVLLAVLIGVLLFYDRKMLLRADFCLLLTFVCFFVFAGNLGRIGAVDAFLRRLMEKHTLLTGAAASQVISNVPAAVLLSAFTDDARALLLGVNVGGLGTPIASLASLIGLKLYSQTERSDPKRFMLLFLAVNFGLLALLLWFASAL